MLIDDILYVLGQMGDTTGLEPNLHDGLAMALRFQIDNVAHYAYENNYRNERGISLRDRIPNIAPLAPVMWFEYGGLAVGKRATNHYGCLISVDYDRDDKENAYQTIKWAGFDFAEKTRWMLRLQCFCNLPDGLSAMNWINYLSVTEDGEYDGFIGKEKSSYVPRGNVSVKETWNNKCMEDINHISLYIECAIALTSICFAHCKGTEIEEHKPTRQVRRAAEHTGKPVISFHTIDINPSAKVLRTEGKISENGLVKALHICRGHFAHYTADKPLFGKHTGTFYRPMHVRGSAEQGVTIKDYRVHSMDAEEV